ncbi:hypothetical protein DICVIV_13418 [Dictyocaulus viviparus]|uniref:DUF7778 domain-containing protein n=1 Tax=Dictyocaulus viviparus TaxID=29172 RepID=A0A0D8XDV7_DICVI|nr:hypothetical protein DICVIV_13418 [Dictyocaulus viviparus]
MAVRKRNGLFWHSYKIRTCVLLNNGFLLVYSSPFDGLSIYLPGIGSLKHRFSRNDSNSNQTRCDILISKGRAKLEILIKGDQSTVLAWRRGIVCSHEGLPISGSLFEDELVINQSNVNAELSRPLSCLSSQDLLSDNTMQNVNQNSYVNQPKYCSMMYTHSDNCNRSPLPARNSVDECTYITDSGVWSFISECPEMGKEETVEQKTPAQFVEGTACGQKSNYMHWRGLNDLPMLSAEILNFESAFRREDPFLRHEIA